MIAYLQPTHTSQASFGNKASIEITGDTKKLYSYETLVASVTNGKAEVYNLQSRTTLKHVKDFLLQYGFKAENKQQILNDYKGR